MRDGPFKAGNAHRVVPAETSEKCRDGSQQTKLRGSSERGPACGQGSLGRFSEGGIWAGATVRGTEGGQVPPSHLSSEGVPLRRLLF